MKGYKPLSGFGYPLKKHFRHPYSTKYPYSLRGREKPKGKGENMNSACLIYGDRDVLEKV